MVTMFSKRCGPLLMLMFTTLFLNDVHGECQIGKHRNGDPLFPPPFLYEKEAKQYALKVEVNDILKMRSMYATEYYDFLGVLDKMGRVDTHFNGTKKTFLYNQNTKEVFIFGDHPDCQTKKLNNHVKPPHEDFNVYDWTFTDINTENPVPTFGPFAMLMNGYTDKEQGGLQYLGLRTVRGLVADVWKRCAEENLTVHYMLSNPQKNGKVFGYGGLPIPLRITVEGTVNSIPINQTYEFVHFQEGITDAVSVFSIPFQKGCQHLIEPEEKIPFPNDNDTSLAFEAEVVATVYSENDTHIYITSLKAALDPASQLFEYTTIPWIAHNDPGFANQGDEVFKVFDAANGYLYEMDLEAGSCEISARNVEESAANLDLPNGDHRSIIDPNLIILNWETAQEFKYLGEGTERGKKVNVFERKWFDLDLPDTYTYIVTHYYLADGQEEVGETKEKKSLVKVVYSDYIAHTRTTSLVFNFYRYQRSLHNLKDIFDVSACFPEQNQTEWFQVIFPLDNVSFDAEDLRQALPKIEKEFLVLLNLDHIITPVRIPRIMVDFDADFVYITAAVRERVPAKLDFKSEGNVRLSPGIDVVPQGIMTEEGCFQACIRGGEKCKGISYCGANCAILVNQNYTSGMGSDDQNCALYTRVKFSTQLTLEEINKKIQERIDIGDFKVVFSDKKKKLQTLKNPEFRKGVAFGLNNFHNDGANKHIDTSFTIFKPGYNIKIADISSTKHSFVECQQECLRDPTCESFSFCDFTSSCSLSKYHSEYLDVKNLAQDDKCIILTRNYIYSFSRFDGKSQITKAEVEMNLETPDSCAMACVKEKSISCRSFDICIDTGKAKCYLHSTHVLDSKGANVQNASACEHYSRNYLIDFSVEKGKSILESAVKERIHNLQTAEECAKLCVEDDECKSFDFCRKPFEIKSQCYISTSVPSQSQKKADETCSLYTRSDAQTEKMLADGDGKEKEVEIIDDTGFSKALTGGIGFFLFLVGIAIGGAAMFGYGYYKANRRV